MEATQAEVSLSFATHIFLRGGEHSDRANNVPTLGRALRAYRGEVALSSTTSIKPRGEHLDRGVPLFLIVEVTLSFTASQIPPRGTLGKSIQLRRLITDEALSFATEEVGNAMAANLRYAAINSMAVPTQALSTTK